MDGELLDTTIVEELDAAKLTAKQKRFVQEYLVILDGTKAARKAGYSLNCAHQQAYENLRKLKIRRIIDHAFHIRSRACLIRARIIGPNDEIPERLR